MTFFCDFSASNVKFGVVWDEIDVVWKDCGSVERR